VEEKMATFGAFSAPGRWFRGNCHTHTRLSDGKSSAAQVAQAYRRKGYDFLVLTDHGRAHDAVSGLCDDGFLVINGAELHPPTLGGRRDAPHHIVGIGVERSPEGGWVKKATASAVIRWIEREGGVAVYGHPYWSGHDLDVMREGKRAFGVEVFNSVCEVCCGLGDSSVLFDQALSAGVRWRAFASDDAHRLKRDAFGGWIMVRARELTKRAILDALRKGRFYATQGPEIRSLRVRDGVVHLACSPVRRIVWHAEGPYGFAVIAKRAGRSRSRFPLRRIAGHSKYLRVEIVDAAGRKAWSNPIWRDARAGGWRD
jgi:hypothetical protein